MSQKPTKTNFMLVWCLGRETTPYKAAEKYYTTYDPNVKFNPKNTSPIGPFYNAEKELKKGNLLIEFPRKGREIPIKTNMETYLADFSPVKPYLAEFEKYAPKIVDKMVDRKLAIINGYEPLFYFLFTKMLLWAEREANGKWITEMVMSIAIPNGKSEVLNCVTDFKNSLTNREVQELTLKVEKTEALINIFQTIIQKMPEQLMRQYMMLILANPKLLKFRVVSNNK